MHILVVLPRRSPTYRDIPNSVDLCVHDLVSASRHRSATCIVAERVHGIFDAFETADIPSFAGAHSRLIARHVAHLAERRKPNLVVVHQHFQIAARLAPMLPGRVVFHAHGFYKSYPKGLIATVRRGMRLKEIRRLAGLVHVSEACRAHFNSSWPEVRLPQAVVHNGLDFRAWHPEALKRNEVLCVGRCVPEKGILEAALAVARVLPERPGWNARFVLSELDRNSGYSKRVEEVLSQEPLRNRIETERNISWLGVKERYERAAIALVPSRWREPFGRTALEAHAGGAALVSSGSGGLSEVSGPFALFADPADVDGFAEAIRRLIDNEPLRRELSQGGAQYVRRRFSIESVAAANDAFLERIRAGQNPC